MSLLIVEVPLSQQHTHKDTIRFIKPRRGSFQKRKKQRKKRLPDCPLVYRMPNFPKSYPKEFLDKSPKSAAICFRIVRVVAVTQDDARVVARKCVFVSEPLMLSISAHQSDRRPSLSLKLPHHFLTQWLQRAAPLSKSGSLKPTQTWPSTLIYFNPALMHK